VRIVHWVARELSEKRSETVGWTRGALWVERCEPGTGVGSWEVGSIFEMQIVRIGGFGENSSLTGRFESVEVILLAPRGPPAFSDEQPDWDELPILQSLVCWVHNSREDQFSFASTDPGLPGLPRALPAPP